MPIGNGRILACSKVYFYVRRTNGYRPAVAAGKVKIGFVTTITTFAGVIGKDMVDAVKLAMEDIDGKWPIDVELLLKMTVSRPSVNRKQIKVK